MIDYRATIAFVEAELARLRAFHAKRQKVLDALEITIAYLGELHGGGAHPAQVQPAAVTGAAALPAAKRSRQPYRRQTQPTPEAKHCGHCGETKPAQEFHRSTKRPDGLQLYCKPCLNEASRRSRLRNTSSNGCQRCGGSMRADAYGWVCAACGRPPERQ